MGYDEFRQLFDTTAAEILGPARFVRSDTARWVRAEGEELNLVELQKHSTDPCFAVNLGVHYSFLPAIGGDLAVSQAELEFVDCELRFRLTDEAHASDQWWPMAKSSIEEVLKVLTHCGFQLFEKYRHDRDIRGLNGADVEHGNADMLSSLTKVRACLLIARIQEHLGNRERSLAAAETGLKLAGLAFGPKKALKDLIARNS